MMMKSMNKMSKLTNPLNTLILVLYLLITYNFNIKAQGLDQILNALDKKDLGKHQATEEIAKDSWVDPNSNLAKIFAGEGRGVYNVLDWLGDLTDKEFKLSNKSYKKHNEYVALKVNYLTANKNVILLNVLILHPKFTSLLGTGLLQEFHDQEPPGLSVEISEKMNFKNSEATYHHHRNGGCSLLFKLPKNSTLNIIDKKCTDNKDIIRLAELLDIDRLQQKLVN